MRRVLRAAAQAAAALLFCVSFSLASPAFAQLANADAGQRAQDHSAQSLGLDGATDPLTEEGAPAVTQAIVPFAPQALLDRQPGDDETRDSGEQSGRSLADLVSDYSAADTPDEETDCLARAVYWESKGEPLVGQLAVADVIINRAQSGRFASTICGVVRQRSQFSFVRGGYIPPAPQGSPQWRTAVAIARIARQDLAGDAAPQALFFHARSVHPGWRLTRVASVGNHIFYR
jgi:N-acetylmuramoyl-L-alanine amidase